MNRLNSEEVNSLLQAADVHSTVYLIGAGGSGMSGLAHLLLDMGLRVKGSDLVLNDEIKELRERDAEIHLGHSAWQITAARPVLVVYSSAIRLDNPELRAAEHLHIPIVRRATLLAALVHRQRGLCVAGMHGKSTTAALLAYALQNLQANPSYAVGAVVPQFLRHARLAASSKSPDAPGVLSRKASICAQPAAAQEMRQPSVYKGHNASRACRSARREPVEVSSYFAVEADESDGTLHEFRPEAAIVLNVDEEHLDYYANLEAVCREFEAFGQQTKGPLIFCADDARLAALYARNPRAISYGFHPLAHYRIEAKPSPQPVSVEKQELHADPLLQPRPKTEFEVWHGGKRLGRFTTLLLGEKNLSNTCAVIALLNQLGYEASQISEAIASFQGVKRRQQELFRDRCICLVEDYGHHPAEIEATLKALTQLGYRRLLVAFQPHRFTRTRFLFDQLATCFRGADRLWITEVYAASEEEIPGISGRQLAEAIRPQGPAVDFVPTLPELRRAVRAAIIPGDLVLFLGAGDITKTAHELADELSKST